MPTYLYRDPGKDQGVHIAFTAKSSAHNELQRYVCNHSTYIRLPENQSHLNHEKTSIVVYGAERSPQDLSAYNHLFI